jgi:hypothetical protein
MSSTTAPTTFLDLYTDLLNRVRQDTSTSASVTQAKRYVNIALYDMHIGFHETFPWAERRAILNTHAPYTTGTLSVSQGGTALTGSGTAWDTANSFGEKNMRVGGKIRIDGAYEVYEISAVGSDTSATISSRFVPADVSAGAYEYFEDEYALASDFLRPVDHRKLTDGGLQIELIGRQLFRSMFPQNYLTGTPSVGTIIDLPSSGDTTPVRKLRLHSPPDKVYQLPYSYITSNLCTDTSGTAQEQLSGDTDEPIVPVRYRQVIVLHGLYHWYRDKKDDTRAAEVRAEYVDLLSRATADNEIGSQRMAIVPRRSPYASRARAPWSHPGGNYGTGTSFDQILDGGGGGGGRAGGGRRR